MELTNGIKLTFKPFLIGVLSLTSFSLLVVLGTASLQYYQYLNSYHTSQQKEVAIISQKTKSFLKKLKEMLNLTGDRIKVSLKDTEKIKNILSSTPRLYAPQDLPKIKTFSYFKVSPPPITITRLGVLSSVDKKVASLSSSLKKISFLFQQDNVIARAPLLEGTGKIEGILEVQVSLADFQSFLGDYKTLSFHPLTTTKKNAGVILQKTPFPLHSKSPEHYWKFLSEQKALYAFYFFYILFSLFLLYVISVYMHWCIKKAYKNILKILKSNLSESKTNEEKTIEDFILLEQKFKTHQVSCHAKRTMNTLLNERQQEKTHHLRKSLKLLEHDLGKLGMPYELEQPLKTLERCLHLANSLENRLIFKEKREAIDFKNLLEDIRHFFAEKMYKANITFDLSCPSKIIFFGDLLFIKAIFVNIIGKSVHRVSRNGKITVKVERIDDTLRFRLRDKGFTLIEASEQHIKRAFDFVIMDDLLQKMCQEAGISYYSSKDKNGFNVHEILISLTAEEAPNSNVIKLFS